MPHDHLEAERFSEPDLRGPLEDRLAHEARMLSQRYPARVPTRNEITARSHQSVGRRVRARVALAAACLIVGATATLALWNITGLDQPLIEQGANPPSRSVAGGSGAPEVFDPSLRHREGSDATRPEGIDEAPPSDIASAAGPPAQPPGLKAWPIVITVPDDRGGRKVLAEGFYVPGSVEEVAVEELSPAAQRLVWQILQQTEGDSGVEWSL